MKFSIHAMQKYASTLFNECCSIWILITFEMRKNDVPNFQMFHIINYTVHCIWSKHCDNSKTAINDISALAQYSLFLWPLYEVCRPRLRQKTHTQFIENILYSIIRCFYYISKYHSMESVERSVLLHQVVFFSPYFLFSSVIRSKQYLGVPRHIFANRTNIRH